MTYYFTFGHGHHDTHGRSLLGWYTSINAASEIEARQTYAAKFGDKWSFTYTGPEFQQQIADYDLRYEAFEVLDLCCQVRQDKYLQLLNRAETVVDKLEDLLGDE